MTTVTMILVAMVLLSGATKAKDGRLTPFSVQPGTELTDAVIAQLGLADAEVAALLEKGAIAEVAARVASSADVDAAAADLAELEAELAAETKRADDAEAKVKDLEAKLAAKPAGAAA